MLNSLFARFSLCEFVGDLEINAAAQCPIEGTLHGISAMDLLDHAADVFGRYQPMANENPANDKHAIVGFHLAAHFTHQSPAACFDLPRCQRGGKCAL